MVIDFDKIELSVLPHFKGGDGEMRANIYFDGTNKIMRGCLAPGSSIGCHCHENDCEVIFITNGLAKCLYDGAEELLTPGQCFYCPKGHSHNLVNASATEPLTYIAIVPAQ